MSLEELQKRFEDLSRRHRKASGEKSKLEVELDLKKKELSDLLDEIKAAGYDPKNLKRERDQAEHDLAELMDEYEKNLASVEEALDAYKKR